MHKKNWRNHKREAGKGLMAGLVGGLAATWTMNQFQTLLSKASEQNTQQQQQEDQGAQSQEVEDGDATQKAAAKLSESVFNRNLTKQEKDVAGSVLHYAFGATMGGLYGVTAELFPVVKAGFGLPFATALWVGADEVAVPALGLSNSPLEYPISNHASALAAHWVYGASTELLRRTVRTLLG